MITLTLARFGSWVAVMDRDFKISGMLKQHPVDHLRVVVHLPIKDAVYKVQEQGRRFFIATREYDTDYHEVNPEQARKLVEDARFSDVMGDKVAWTQ